MSKFLTLEMLGMSREITIETVKLFQSEGSLEIEAKTPQEIVAFLNDIITHIQDKLLEIENINEADYSELEFIIQTILRNNI